MTGSIMLLRLVIGVGFIVQFQSLFTNLVNFYRGTRRRRRHFRRQCIRKSPSFIRVMTRCQQISVETSWRGPNVLLNGVVLGVPIEENYAAKMTCHVVTPVLIEKTRSNQRRNQMSKSERVILKCPRPDLGAS